MSAPSRARTVIDCTLRLFTCWPPSTRLRAVVIGISTRSSWSWPIMLWPLRSSTPITWCGTRRMRTVSPTGSASPNSDFATVWPSSTTFAAESTCDWSNGLPDATSHCRASRNSGVVPWICVAQLLLPNTTCPLPRSDGRGGLHALHLALHRIGVVLGDRQLRARALARAAHREVAGQDDDEVGAQALDLVLDARLRAGADGDHRDHRAHADDDAEHRQRGAQLVDAQRGQRDAQRGEEVHACRKVGSDTTFSATRSPGVADASGIRPHFAARGERGVGVRGRVARVGDDLPVAERDQPRRERRDVLLVRDDDDRDAGAVELLQQRHHLEARRGIERAGGLVGEDELGIVDQRARDGDALLLAAGKLRGMMIRARAKPDLLQLLHRARTTLRRRDAAVEQRQLDVFQRRRARAAG